MIKNLAILLLSAGLCFSQQDLMNRFMLGQNFEQSGDFEKAKQIFEELYQKQPDNFQFFDALNRVYLQLKDYDNSIKMIEQYLNLNPSDINLYGLLGKTYYIKGEEQKAFDIWEKALMSSAGSPNNYRIIANYAIERRAFEKAIEYLNKGKEVSDDPRIFSFDLANLYSLTMRYKDAAGEYCSIISAHPKQYQLVESRILLYINKPGAIDQTIDVVEDFRGGNNLSFDYLLARLLMEKNELNKAFEIYLEIDEKQNNMGADLYNFANFAYSEKHYELAAKVYNEVIKKYPATPVISSAKLGYAKTMEEALNAKDAQSDNSWKPFYKTESVESGEVDQIVAAYEELVQMYPRTDVAGESLVRIGYIYLLKKNDLSSAEDIFNRIIKDFSNSPFVFDAYDGLADVYIFKDDLNSAEKNLSSIIKNRRAAEDTKNRARFKLAKINFYKGDFNAAKNILADVLSNLKDNIANDAIDLSLLMNTNINDSSGLLVYAEAEKLLTQKKFEEASALLKEIASDRQSFILQNKAEVRLAETELARDNIEESVSILTKISSEPGKNIYADRSVFLLGKIYQFGVKDDTKAVEMYESLLAKFPNSLYLDEAREEIIKIRDKINQGT